MDSMRNIANVSVSKSSPEETLRDSTENIYTGIDLKTATLLQDQSYRIGILEGSMQSLKVSVDDLQVSMTQRINDLEEKLNDKEKLKAFPDSVELGFVYVLLLKEGFFYVGYTSNLKRRIQEHLEGGEKAAKLVRMHPMEKLLACFKGRVEDEDIVTLKMMIVFGWERVRGGKWVFHDMHEAPEELFELQKKPNLNFLQASAPDFDICAKCHIIGHAESTCLVSGVEEDKSASKRENSKLSYNDSCYTKDIHYVETCLHELETLYIFVKMVEPENVLINGFFDKEGTRIFSNDTTKIISRTPKGRKTIESVVWAMKAIEHSGKKSVFSIVLRDVYPFEMLLGLSEPKYNQDMIEEGKALKKTLEAKGQSIRFICSINIGWTSTGSTQLNELFANLS